MLDSPEWPNHLDALVAAPEHHHLLFEDDSVRVLGIRISPGQTVPLHTHRWPGILYLIAWSDIVRRDRHGTVLLDSRNSPARLAGSAFWTPAMGPHTLENVGSTELHIIGVELKTHAEPAIPQR